MNDLESQRYNVIAHFEALATDNTAPLVADVCECVGHDMSSKFVCIVQYPDESEMVLQSDSLAHALVMAAHYVNERLMGR